VAGALATFTSAASGGAAQVIATGTMSITANPTTLPTGATAIAPGDWIDRTVDLHNGGGVGWSDVTLSIADGTSAPNLTGGHPAGCTPACGSTTELQVAVIECSVPWTHAANGSPPPNDYSCSGTTTTLLSATPASTVSGAALAFAGNDPVLSTSGASAHLVVELTFPSGSPNQYQNVSSSLTYTFTAVQRPGQSA
jgi:spore coat-associated protein N